MRVMVCPDKFKESLSASQAAEAISKGIVETLRNVEVIQRPLADGGEGTVEALVKATGGQIIKCAVTGPLGGMVDSFYGVLGDGETAVIEMAAASGLHLVPPEKRNPLLTTTFGTGELIRLALKWGCKKIIVGVGGSATNDGGAGMAQALGVKLLDEKGRQIGWGGEALSNLKRIDPSLLPPQIEKTEVIVASDCTNSLYGPTGASRVYSPQKGATPEMVERLEAALMHYAEVIERDLGKNVKDIPGAGAAGGLGAGLAAFLNASIKPGIKVVLETIRFEETLEDVNLIITGEGKIDRQTSFGKTISGVIEIARRHDIPVIALTGNVSPDSDVLYEEGISSIVSIIPRPMTLREAVQDADTLLTNAAATCMRLIKTGLKIGGNKPVRNKFKSVAF